MKTLANNESCIAEIRRSHLFFDRLVNGSKYVCQNWI